MLDSNGYYNWCKVHRSHCFIWVQDDGDIPFFHSLLPHLQFSCEWCDFICQLQICICKFSSLSFWNISLRYASFMRKLLLLNLLTSSLPSSSRKFLISSRNSNTLDKTLLWNKTLAFPMLFDKYFLRHINLMKKQVAFWYIRE